MKEDRLRLGVRKDFFTAGEARHWKFVQRGCGIPIPGGVQYQAGTSSCLTSLIGGSLPLVGKLKRDDL